jgi:5-(carboxyamino)imidazole ribonucleotide synthase
VGALVVGAYDDPDGLDRLAAGVDVVTFEFENVPVEAARRVAAVPGMRALELGQDRLVEKELFRRLGIETAPFGTLSDTGLPALVKSRRLGYDGKGQRVVEDDGRLGDDELAEGIVSFDRELSIVAVRGRDGDTRFYPLAENEHRGGILAVSRAPAHDAPQSEAEEIATRLLEELDYVGVLAVELFDVGGRLLANEFAPRVHNTGHWTIDGADTSQFENHLRAILGLPLGSTAARGGSVMVNLVGALPPLEQLLAIPGAHVHLYGKEPRPGRKLGHVTLVDADVEREEEAAALAAASWHV